MGAAPSFSDFLTEAASLSHPAQVQMQTQDLPSKSNLHFAEVLTEAREEGIYTAYPVANQLNLLLRNFSSPPFLLHWHSSLQVFLPSNIQNNSAWDHNPKLEY